MGSVSGRPHNNRKCSSAHHDLGWYYLFPADAESRDPDSEFFGRHHVHQDTIRDWMKSGTSKCGFMKKYTPHNLRHSYATHMLENGVPIHVVQKLMGHEDIRTTEGYLHLCRTGPTSAKSPADFLNLAMREKQKPVQQSHNETLAEALRSPTKVSQSRRDYQGKKHSQESPRLKLYTG